VVTLSKLALHQLKLDDDGEPSTLVCVNITTAVGVHVHHLSGTPGSSMRPARQILPHHLPQKSLLAYWLIHLLSEKKAEGMFVIVQFLCSSPRVLFCETNPSISITSTWIGHLACAVHAQLYTLVSGSHKRGQTTQMTLTKGMFNVMFSRSR